MRALDDIKRDLAALRAERRRGDDRIRELESEWRRCETLEVISTPLARAATACVTCAAPVATGHVRIESDSSRDLTLCPDCVRAAFALLEEGAVRVDG